MGKCRCGLCGFYEDAVGALCYLDDYEEFMERFESLEKKIEELERRIQVLENSTASKIENFGVKQNE